MKVKKVRGLDDRAITPELVKHINNAGTTWRASLEQGGLEKMTVREARSMLGVLPGGPKLTRKTFTRESHQGVPDSFDSRTNWPKCVTMKAIRDQSACGSCWAFGAVEAMSDRYCVALGKTNMSISAEDLNSCCDFCGMGCGGGYPSAAWSYWQSTGLVSETCAPYSLPSCDHHLPNSPNPCPRDEYPTPDCPTRCEDGSSMKSSKHYASNVYAVSGEADIQQEIFKNGPVEVAFSVYEDFLTYKSGVYSYTTGSFLGGHAVKMLGWGVENNVPYWICANSWNPHWGDQGYFKIKRGGDECGIEDEADAGIPKS